ncbi:hypothetical protein CYMTET_41416 [Cymbomonas tetramitiformis]|uniref:Uncharacterized protein n=1 Tax=Cymbomonas tetramitiformis TaxID=36881 RepID=A0AAE0C7I7_9CHLO|nr:hypothetical protein CYMTET_41416 [Cymbomonas tetramitiformis]
MRSLTTVMHKYIQEFPLLLHLITDIVCCGILGNFQHSDVKLDAKTRRFLYASKHVVRRILVDIFAKGVEDMYILFCIREYIVASVSANIALSNTVHTLVPKWSTITSIITNVVNMSRCTVSKQTFNSIDPHPSGCHQAQYELLSDYMHRCSYHMKLTNRTIPRLPLSACFATLPTFISQHPCFENLLRTDALMGNAQLSTFPSTDCGHRMLANSDTDESYILRIVKKQLHQLAKQRKDEVYCTDVMIEQPEEKQVWKTYTLAAVFMIGTCFAPGIVKLPNELAVMQKDAVRRNMFTDGTHTSSLTLKDICTLHYCVACQEVKNVTGEGDYGLDMTSVDLSSGCFYCANNKCRLTERVPLLRIVLCSEDDQRSFMCVIKNQCYAMSPCCGRLVTIDPVRLLCDSAADRKCQSCIDQEVSTPDKESNRRVSKGNSKKRTSAQAVQTCAHCQESSFKKGKAHSVRVKECSDSATYEWMTFCSAHYRTWMKVLTDEVGYLVMPKQQLHARINETSKYSLRETDTYVKRKHR